MVRSLFAKRFLRLPCLVVSLASLSLWANAARGDCCIANGNSTTGMSTASGGRDQACDNATSKCCTLTASGLQDSVDGSGNHTCTGICGLGNADTAGDMLSICPSDTPTQTPTSTPTITNTPTNTPTATPTNTGIPQGDECSIPAACSTGFCVDGVCCDTACTDPLTRCNLAGQVGTCASAAAEAPTLTPWGMIAGLVLLAGTAAWAIRRRVR